MRIVLEGTAKELAAMLKAVTSDEVKADVLLQVLADQGILSIEKGPVNTKEDEVFSNISYDTLHLAAVITTLGKEEARGIYLDIEAMPKYYSLNKLRSMAGGAKKVCTRFQMPLFIIAVRTKTNHRYIVNREYLTALTEYLESEQEYIDWVKTNGVI